VAQWQRWSTRAGRGDVPDRRPDGGVRLASRGRALDGIARGSSAPSSTCARRLTVAHGTRDAAEAPAPHAARPPDARRDRIRTALRGAAERARMAASCPPYDDAPCGYSALDADGVIVAVNEIMRAAATTGAPSSSAAPLAELLRGQRHAPRRAVRLETTAVSAALELDATCRDGRLVVSAAWRPSDTDGHAAENAPPCSTSPTCETPPSGGTLEQALAARRPSTATGRLDEVNGRLTR
jgi:PAS domain-containing protein